MKYLFHFFYCLKITYDLSEKTLTTFTSINFDFDGFLLLSRAERLDINSSQISSESVSGGQQSQPGFHTAKLRQVSIFRMDY